MAEPTEILILGGYGGTGKRAAHSLLDATRANVVIAGRNLERAEALSGELAAQFGRDRVRAAMADAKDSDSLHRAFAGVDLVYVCSDTAEYARVVALACLERGCDYLDIHFSEQHLPQLRKLAGEIALAGRCFITQAGSHPGIAPAMVRLAAEQLSRIDRVQIGGMLKIKEVDLQACRTFLRSIHETKPRIYRDGSWEDAGNTTARVDFGPPLGAISAYPSYIGEMESLPAQFDIGELGVYMGGLNWFVDTFAILPSMLGLAKYPASLELLSKLCRVGLRRFTTPPLGFWYKLSAWGKANGEDRRIDIDTYAEDPYLHTAAPVTGCLKQLMDGRIRKPGLFNMGQIVEPRPLFAEMKSQGVSVQTSGLYIPL